MDETGDRTDGRYLSDPLIQGTVKGEVYHFSIEGTRMRLIAAYTSRLGELTLG
jgi:hypothetical protein